MTHDTRILEMAAKILLSIEKDTDKIRSGLALDADDFFTTRTEREANDALARTAYYATQARVALERLAEAGE